MLLVIDMPRGISGQTLLRRVQLGLGTVTGMSSWHATRIFLIDFQNVDQDQR